MEKLGTSKNCFLYALELWTADIIREELKLNYFIDVEIIEAGNGDIHLNLQDKRYTVRL